MASEDVLAELYYWIGRVERDEPGVAEYLEDLAAEVRKLRALLDKAETLLLARNNPKREGEEHARREFVGAKER